MKYEKYSFVVFIFIITLILEIFFFINLYSKKNDIFISYNCIVYKDNLIMLIINDNDLKSFYKNRFIYLNGKKYLFNINSITKNVMKKDNVIYNEVLISFKLPNKYKDNDVINISLRNDREPIIKMFKIIWKGDIT